MVDESVWKKEALQQALAAAKKYLDLARDLAEELQIDISFMGATYSWDEECWSVKRKFSQETFEWSDSGHCAEYG